MERIVIVCFCNENLISFLRTDNVMMLQHTAFDCSKENRNFPTKY